MRPEFRSDRDAAWLSSSQVMASRSKGVSAADWGSVPTAGPAFADQGELLGNTRTGRPSSRLSVHNRGPDLPRRRAGTKTRSWRDGCVKGPCPHLPSAPQLAPRLPPFNLFCYISPLDCHLTQTNRMQSTGIEQQCHANVTNPSGFLAETGRVRAGQRLWPLLILRSGTVDGDSSETPREKINNHGGAAQADETERDAVIAAPHAHARF